MVRMCQKRELNELCPGHKVHSKCLQGVQDIHQVWESKHKLLIAKPDMFAVQFCLCLTIQVGHCGTSVDSIWTLFGLYLDSMSSGQTATTFLAPVLLKAYSNGNWCRKLSGFCQEFEKGHCFCKHQQISCNCISWVIQTSMNCFSKHAADVHILLGRSYTYPWNMMFYPKPSACNYAQIVDKDHSKTCIWHEKCWSCESRAVILEVLTDDEEGPPGSACCAEKIKLLLISLKISECISVLVLFAQVLVLLLWNRKQKQTSWTFVCKALGIVVILEQAATLCEFLGSWRIFLISTFTQRVEMSTKTVRKPRREV